MTLTLESPCSKKQKSIVVLFYAIFKPLTLKVALVLQVILGSGPLKKGHVDHLNL